MTEKARDARPPQRAGSARRFAQAGRIPALRAAFAPAGTPALSRISSSRKTLDEMKPGENRWNCVASIPAS